MLEETFLSFLLIGPLEDSERLEIASDIYIQGATNILSTLLVRNVTRLCHITTLYSTTFACISSLIPSLSTS